MGSINPPAFDPVESRVFPENVNSWIFQVCVGVHMVEGFLAVGREAQRRKQKMRKTDEVRFCLAMAACSWFPWQWDAGAEMEMERKRDGAKKLHSALHRSVSHRAIGSPRFKPQLRLWVAMSP